MATLFNLAVIDGVQYLTIRGGDWSDDYEALKDKPVKVTIKEDRPRRSLDANAYCWAIIDRVAERLHMSKIDVYRECIRHIAGVADYVCIKTAAVERFAREWERNGLGWFCDVEDSKLEGFSRVCVYYGSSTYDSKQMSALINEVVQAAAALNIETLTPAQIAQLGG